MHHANDNFAGKEISIGKRLMLGLLANIFLKVKLETKFKPCSHKSFGQFNFQVNDNIKGFLLNHDSFNTMTFPQIYHFLKKL